MSTDPAPRSFPTQPALPSEHSVTATLSLWDSLGLIVGIVVGSSIYEISPLVFLFAASPVVGLALWAVGGGLSLVGGLVYAELATTYPRCGGEYNYLTRAFGPFFGFLFAWSQLVIIQTASIGAMAFVFANYAVGLGKLPEWSTAWLAAAAVVILTLLNFLGLRAGARIQNTLSVAKLVGLSAMIASGLLYGSAEITAPMPPSPGPGWPLALVFVLYAYGGWTDAAFVSAEVRDLKRNIPRALVGGLGLIVLVYLLVNLAYLRALGPEGLSHSNRPAADTLTLLVGPWGGQIMSVLVMASALGAVNGLIFSASRVHATLGQDYTLISGLGGYSRGESPRAALLAQAGVTGAMIMTVGSDWGRNSINRAIEVLGLQTIDWKHYNGGFSTLVAGSAPAFWLFLLLTGIGFFVLRFQDAARSRPFRVPLYPVTPAIFVGMCGWMLYSATDYARPLIPVMSLPILLGIPAYWVCVRANRIASARLSKRI